MNFFIKIEYFKIWNQSDGKAHNDFKWGELENMMDDRQEIQSDGKMS